MIARQCICNHNLSSSSSLAQAPATPGVATDADSRWQSRLRPDFRRAAAEIYFNFGAEGVSNAREWASREIGSMKHTDAFADFWHLATEVEFRLDRMNGEEAEFALSLGGR